MSCFQDSKLSNRLAFYNKLNDKRCSAVDYSRAQMVWNVFNCSTFADYKKVIGKFKHELNSIPMKEFVGLRPKCYSFKYKHGREKKTAAVLK